MKNVTLELVQTLHNSVWNPMYAQFVNTFGRRTGLRYKLEDKLHDPLERRIKLNLMIPLQWRLDGPQK